MSGVFGSSGFMRILTFQEDETLDFIEDSG